MGKKDIKSNQITVPEGISFSSKKGVAQITFSGALVKNNCEAVLQKINEMFADNLTEVKFSEQNLEEWDSSLLLIVYETVRQAEAKKIKYDISALPDNLRELISLAFAVDRKPIHDNGEQTGVLEKIGYQAVAVAKAVSNTLKYLGEICKGIGRLVSFKSVTRSVDFFAALNDCGPKALGIVSLISFLIGLILAFVGVVQLETFGAQIFVAGLVTIGMCRIMGAIMVGIIMSGRTGSSYAATIGTMQVNEELDALETMGLSKIEFLVLPRFFALLIAMPILTMLADIMGMLGGAFVGIMIMDLPSSEYWRYALNAFTLSNFLVGIFHSVCFGAIIALCGCYSGLHCGRNADSVGLATTQSVVCAIVWMIVATGIITVVCQEMGV